jgi:hypothetical protein
MLFLPVGFTGRLIDNWRTITPTKPNIKKWVIHQIHMQARPLEGSVVDLISGIEQQDNFNKQFKYRKVGRTR